MAQGLGKGMFAEEVAAVVFVEPAGDLGAVGGGEGEEPALLGNRWAGEFVADQMS
jgi:hypothetical protein